MTIKGTIGMTISKRNFWLVLCGTLFLATSAHADSPFAGDIKQALSTDQFVVEGYALDKDDLNAFYAARDFQPAWNFAGQENQAAFNAFLDSIGKTIQYHGLEEGDYALDLMRKIATADDGESRLKLELMVADTLLHLAHDLHGDDIDLDQLYPGWNFHRAAVDIPGELAKAVAANSVNGFFESLTPKNPAYTQLAHALRDYRAIAAKGGWNAIDLGPTLRPQDHGIRVAQLRARLAAENYLPDMPAPKNRIFGDKLHKAVAAYQSRNGIDADGNVGSSTLAALNVPIATRVGQIRANMERWRHMSDDYPPARAVIVNIPDASVTITEDGHPVYMGPVIVGQVERKTPFIQSEIKNMIINPAWHVPEKIAREDILPKLKQDPRYLEKQGIVIRGSDYDPHGKHIDWQNVSDEDFDFHLRQEPGKMNSLGRLKFDFDNDFAVYMHGTPHQELFKKHERDLSSGCVRLRDPELVAQIILKDNPGDWDVARIEETIATKKTRWLDIKNPLPVDFVYWTTWVDDAGQIQFRNDVYDYDKFLMENLIPEPKDAAPVDNPSIPLSTETK
jgi:murein L,D-transpeptidase YcbB/YkuD